MNNNISAWHRLLFFPSGQCQLTYPDCIFHKLAVYNPGGYRGIPCVILLVDGIVTYVGSPQEDFRQVLEETLDFLEAEARREE